MGGQVVAGSEIGGYRIEERIARGGMGTVFRARHPRLQSIVALKVLSTELADDDAFRKRFVLESQLASSLHHPNIVPVHDAGEAGGCLYLAMRFVDGPTLRELIAGGELKAARAVALLAQVASALDAAHAEGLVHRDVKPANVLVARGGATEFGEHAYLTDFGVSKQLGSSAHLTSTGQLVGTLHYVAPEQITGDRVDGRCDQYALGCMLYECLTGSPPFAPKADLTVLWAHMHDPPPSIGPERPEQGSTVDAVIARMLAKDPKDRFSSCSEAMEAARRALAASPAPVETKTKQGGRPARVAPILATVGFLAGVGGVLLLATDGNEPKRTAPSKPAGASFASFVGTAKPLVLRSRPQGSPDRRTPPRAPIVSAPTSPSPTSGGSAGGSGGSDAGGIIGSP